MDTLPLEKIYDILIRSDYPSIMDICSTNNKLAGICKDDSFWKEKMDRDYPELLIYKPKNVSYREQYKKLYVLPTLIEGFDPKDLEHLILVYKNRRFEIEKILVNFVHTNSFDILNWYADRGHLPHSDAYYWAAINLNIDAMNWLFSKDIEIPNYIDVGEYWGFVHLIIGTLKIKCTRILRWLEKHYRPSYYDFDDEDDNDDDFDDEDDNDEDDNDDHVEYPLFHIDVSVANLATETGDIKLLKWIEKKRNVLPDIEGVVSSARMGHINVLKWLVSKNIFPNEYAGIESILGGLDTAIWMSNYIKPNVKWANMAAKTNNIDILDWLRKSYGIFPVDNVV